MDALSNSHRIPTGACQREGGIEQDNWGPCPRCNGSGIRLNDRFVGDLVRRRRQARGLTVAQVAAKMGFSAQYLGDLERGHRNCWTHALAEKCLQAIDALQSQRAEGGTQ